MLRSFSPVHQKYYLHNEMTDESKWDEHSTSEEDHP